MLAKAMLVAANPSDESISSYKEAVTMFLEHWIPENKERNKKKQQEFEGLFNKIFKKDK